MCLIIIHGIPMPRLKDKTGVFYQYYSEAMLQKLVELEFSLKSSAQMITGINLPPEKVDVDFPLSILSSAEGKLIVRVENLFAGPARTREALKDFGREIGTRVAYFARENLPRKTRVEIYIRSFDRSEFSPDVYLAVNFNQLP